MKKTQTPQHIAIIMDGNRRWAKERELPELAGHRKVADEILEPLVEHAAKRGVKYITFWAFSTENWNRNASEVSGILSIFRHVIAKRWQRLHEKGVQVRVIGDLTRFPKDIQKALSDVIQQTKDNLSITAIFALNYGGRDEIIRAMNKAVGHQLSVIRRSDDWRQTTEDFSQYLDTAGIPDPDLIIRTGGEHRLSGFLPWQGVYSELYFPPFYMPDFTPEKLDEALEEYDKRTRRFGR